MSINTDRLLNSFMEMVRIDSESGSEENIHCYLRSKLQGLGLEMRTDRLGNIYAQRTAQIAGPALLFSAHMDTVKPGRGIVPQIHNGLISSSGKTILGADDKAGMAAIIEMLETLRDWRAPAPAVQVLFTVSEEVGLKGAKAVKAEYLKADYGLVLDSHGAVGTVVNRAPAHETYVVTVRGRSSHAGIEPEKGLNAITAAAKMIAKFKSGRLNGHTTANVGKISGGTATNVVPDEAIFYGEVRSHQRATLQREIGRIKDIVTQIASQTGVKAEFKSELEYPELTLGLTHPLLKLCRHAAQAIDLNFKVETSGGGSDASILTGLGLPCVVLGIGMTDVHTTKESIREQDLVKSAEYLLAILKIAGEYKK